MTPPAAPAARGHADRLTAAAAGLTALAGLSPLIEPVPLVAALIPQTFAMLLAGLLLTPARAAVAMALVVAAAVLGLPVYIGEAARGEVLFQDGGFLVGLIPAAAITGLIAVRQGLPATTGGRFRSLAGAAIAGVAVLYAVGIAWMIVFAGDPPLDAIAAVAFAVRGDLALALAAAGLALALLPWRLWR
jgi:biotin transport system substrate-specific component